MSVETLEQKARDYQDRRMVKLYKLSYFEDMVLRDEEINVESGSHSI
jgi:hypothetical protein